MLVYLKKFHFFTVAEVKKALTEMSEEDFTKIYKAKQPKKDNEIIFSCKAGNRSQRALRTGLQLGFDKYKDVSFLFFLLYYIER